MTVKQEAFCNFYIETGNATESYARAYDCSKMKRDTVSRKAHELLENGRVAAFLDLKRAELTKQSDIRKQDILEELRAIAFSDISDYVDFDGTRLSVKSFDELTPFQRKAIEGIKEGKYGIELRLHGKNWSIDRICKMMGFDAPVVMEQHLRTGFEDISDEGLQRRLMEMLPR